MNKRKSVKFVFEGQPCKVKITYRGPTTIALVIIGKGDMTGLDRSQRVYCGVSSCNPCDVYDITTGIKLACRDALMIDDCRFALPDSTRRAAIYREIRKALNPHPWGVGRSVMSVMVEEVFDNLPANLPA